MPAVAAGTRPAERVHPPALKVARRRGLDPGKWHAAQVSDVVQPHDS
ncbi:hypothetical protein AB0E63_21790 [Kribbella sp. NPDC026596]